MTAPTKFCVGCRHHVLALGTAGVLWWKRDTVDHRCTAFRETSTDPVTGEVVVFAAEATCSILRANSKLCGSEGLRWEAKP